MFSQIQFFRAVPQVARFSVPENKLCIVKTSLHEVGKSPKIPHISKNARKIYISQNIFEPIQNRVYTRSAILEAAYLKALLYT